MNAGVLITLALSATPHTTVSSTVTAAQPCGDCHTPVGWTPAKFDHEFTGFGLDGGHGGLPCKACHPVAWDQVAGASCRSCHRDPHQGELGARCEGCHDTEDWRSRFDVMAHRRTAFPLSGAHAVIPCEECHPDAPVRGFFRSTVACVECHQADLSRASLVSIDHAQPGFTEACQTCHLPDRFARAAFPQHESCFVLRGTEHAGLSCESCHESVQALRVNGSCNTGTARCTSCHEHPCSEMDQEHRRVAGYECKDRKCYECHRFSD